MKKYLVMLAIVTVNVLGMQGYVEKDEKSNQFYGPVPKGGWYSEGSSYNINNGNQYSGSSEYNYKREYTKPPECTPIIHEYLSEPVFFLPVHMSAPPIDSFVIISREYVDDLWQSLCDISSERDSLIRTNRQLKKQLNRLRSMNENLLSKVDAQEKEKNKKEGTKGKIEKKEEGSELKPEDESKVLVEKVDEEIETLESIRSQETMETAKDTFSDLSKMSDEEDQEKEQKDELEKELEKEIIIDRKVLVDNLMKMIVSGRFDEIEEIIKKDPLIVNEEDKEGNTVLIYAAKEGNLKLVRYFIAHGSDINHTNHKNRTAIIYAAMNGRVKAFKELIKKEDGDINIQDDEGKSALHHIVTSEYENEGTRGKLLALIFSRKDLKVNAADKRGNTSLIYALTGEDEETIKSLLDHDDIDVNHSNKKNYRALTICLTKEDFDTAWLLMDRGGNIELEKERFYGKKIYEGLRICFNVISEIRKGNYDGALVWMKESVDLSKVKGFRASLVYEAIPFIFNALAYPRCIDLEGYTEHHTALIYSIRLGEYQIVERLLKKGASIDSLAVKYAERSRSREMIELLNMYRKIKK